MFGWEKSNGKTLETHSAVSPWFIGQVEEGQRIAGLQLGLTLNPR
jgi:hypothetical protein